MFTFCYAYPKLGVLLHKMANASHSSSGTVGIVTTESKQLFIRSRRYVSHCSGVRQVALQMVTGNYRVQSGHREILYSTKEESVIEKGIPSNG